MVLGAGVQAASGLVERARPPPGVAVVQTGTRERPLVIEALPPSADPERITGGAPALHEAGVPDRNHIEYRS